MVAWRKIGAFLVLAAILSLPGYYLGIHGHILRPRLASAVLMWGPGLAAIIVRLVSEKSLAGIGFASGRPVWLLIALALPLAYALPVYLLAWSSGLGGFAPGLWPAVLPYGLHATGAAPVLLLILSFGLLDKISRALGEETGWRGLLVPELLKVTTFRNASLISGGIWALWHFPLIIFADYKAAGTPVVFQLACFALMVVSSSFLYAWLRLRSGSVWPPTLLHAAHNLLIQSVLDQATTNRGGVFYLTTEFGLGVALCTVLVAWLLLSSTTAKLLWRRAPLAGFSPWSHAAAAL